MAKIFVSFNISGVTDNCFLVAYELQNLGAEVYRSAVLTPPHGQREFTIDNLNPVMHRVQIWTTLNSVTLSTLIGSCDIDASIEGIGSMFFQFIVDRGQPEDPADGDTQFVADGVTIPERPDLSNVENYLVFKPGYGPLIWGFHIQKIAGGGFEFINGGVFNSLEEYTISWIEATQVSNPSIMTGDITDVVLISAHTVLDDTHRNKLIVFNFAGNDGVAVMPDLNTIANRTIFAFNTHQGNQINGEIQFESGQGVYLRGVLTNPLLLGKNECIKMVVKNGVCYIVNDYDYPRVGQRIWSDILTEPNTLLLDGTEYDGLVYKRAWDYIVNRLPGTQKVTYTQFNQQQNINGENVYINRGFFAVDLVNTAFKVPDMNNRSIRALKTGADATRINVNPGGYQHDSFRSHGHAVATTGVSSSTPVNPKKSLKRYAQEPDPYDMGVAGIGPFIQPSGGAATYPANIGLYPCVII